MEKISLGLLIEILAKLTPVSLARTEMTENSVDKKLSCLRRTA